MNKKAYEFSFAWLFTVFVGAVIIFFAIYAATQLVGTKRLEQETIQAKQIGIILSPVETTLEEAKTATISSKETQINNDCSERGTFGSQDISVSINYGIGGNSKTSGIKSSFHNKYLFSAKTLEADEEFYVLSKPFEFPFKIADLIILWSDTQTYCFISPPPDIKAEIEDLNLKGVSLNDCLSDSKEVCFGAANCDINVRINAGSGTVRYENGEVVSFVESSTSSDKFSLLFAAIFSEPEIYECQLKRIMSRASQIALLQKKKSEFLGFSCGGSVPIQSNLDSYSRAALSLTESSQLKETISSEAESLKEKNDFLVCQLF